MEPHIAEVLLEDHARGGCLSGADLIEHLKDCQVCQDRLAEMREYVQFTQLDPVEASGHIRCRHLTPEGTVFLVVTGSDAVAWHARMIGPGIWETRDFVRGCEAKAWLERRFETLFAWHECGGACHDWR